MGQLLLLNEHELDKYLEGVPVISDNYPYTEFPMWRWLLDPEWQKICNTTSVTQWKNERNL